MASKMTQDADASRTQMIHRLNESGFQPRTIDQILRMIDAMLTGRIALAHVLVAAMEVCKGCELSRTHRHIANALECLADEVMQEQTPSLAESPVARLVARGMALPKGISSSQAGSSKAWQGQMKETYSKAKGAK